ncbi:TonB family protein [Leptolyngbya sp. 15MV]|nr:TonB family protein [Leptolyngbya sp. 15MV]
MKIAVLINEEGNVVSAEPVYNEDVMFRSDGRTVEKQPSEQPHPLLVDEAKKTALEAKFAPTILSGHPVKVKGVLVYNFGGETGETAAAQSLPDVEPVATRGNMPMPISGGVLNGKALSLPQPVYPPAARALKADGAVIVQVVVDENGEIISASAVSGHPLLRISSEKAARLARFSPTTLNGQPVKVSGVITYNYVLTLGEDEVQALWGFGFIFKFIASADQELLGYFGTEAFNDIVKEMSEDIPEGLEFLRPMLAKIPGSDEPVRRRLAEDMLKEFGKRVKNSELPYFNTGILTGELAANIFSMKMERGLGCRRLARVACPAARGSPARRLPGGAGRAAQRRKIQPVQCPAGERRGDNRAHGGDHPRRARTPGRAFGRAVYLRRYRWPARGHRRCGRGDRDRSRAGAARPGRPGAVARA